jgi:hypothetical protein
MARDAFDEFWEAYPRKVGKPAALKVWRRLFRNYAGELEWHIMDGLEQWKQSREWRDRQFIPYPSTFLNQRRWEDVPTPIVQADSGLRGHMSAAARERLDRRGDRT